jgi:hypothetical protein
VIGLVCISPTASEAQPGTVVADIGSPQAAIVSALQLNVISSHDLR